MKKLLMIVGLLSAVSLQAAPININSADAKSISKALNGVGKVRAEAIVQYREQHGKFGSADDLAKVQGVSHRIVEKNREDILLSDN
ncbi:MAG: helix-hairpin-helix domain-containing protein [Gammaproteobacteria bacterium]|nr:helix-hairpin-helix domain-containing protein [Gammaproteobacteria bacterium]MCW8888564.1 helix-hairpin-helix domain-containing protein [Gammaproteobacteria bacterium]